MTQPLIKIEQIDSDSLTLFIRTSVILDDISDVVTSAPTQGQSLIFSGSPLRWRPGTVIGGLGSPSGEVNLVNAQKGDFLFYQGSPTSWTNTSTISLIDGRIIISGITAENIGSPFPGSPAGSPLIGHGGAGSPANVTTLELVSISPGLMFRDTDASANEKVWRFFVDGGDFIGEMRSDSGKTTNKWLEVIRNGNLNSDLWFYIGNQEKAIHAISGAAVELYHNNVNVAETTTPVGGGLRVNNLSTGAGFERVLTTSDIGGGGVTAGDGLFFSGSPTVLNVDSTVARISTGSPGIINVGTLIIDTVDFGARSTITTFETTTTTTSQTIIASFATAIYRSAEFLVEAVQGNNFHVTKLLVTHDDINAVSTEYGTVATPEFFGSPATGSPAISGEQATFTVDISGGNLRLLATPVSSVSTVFTTTATLTKTKV